MGRASKKIKKPKLSMVNENVWNFLFLIGL